MEGELTKPKEEKGRREGGWLYLIRLNRIGIYYLTKRYCVLQHHLLQTFNSPPLSLHQVPVRSAIIDCCVRVADNGRENIHRKVLFTFTLYNSSDHKDKLKLGASSPEDAARWIRSFQKSALKDGENIFGSSRSNRQSSRLRGSKRPHQSNSMDWTAYLSLQGDLVTDVIAPLSWTIFACRNGLRFFKERDKDSQKSDDHSSIMAVGIVDGSSEDIFQALISLGSSRSEWDFCFCEGSVVEHLDGHNDIIHEQLSRDWLPWGIKRRDLLLHRYWRREADGTYVILYHSVVYKKCRPKKGYVRACLKSGGFVVTSLNPENRSVVRHMLAVDWKLWRSYITNSTARSITMRMLERVAGLQELFKAKVDDFPLLNCSHQSEDDRRIDMLTDDGNVKVHLSEEAYATPAVQTSLTGLNDLDDEFFDVPEASDLEQQESSWSYDFGSTCPQVPCPPKLSTTAAGIVKKLQDYKGYYFSESTSERKGYVQIREMVKQGGVSCCYRSTLPKDFTCSQLSTWAMANASTFLIRGPTFLQDQKKVQATSPLMQLVAADWLKSGKREDHLAGRPGSIVQAEGGPEFFLVINIQVPGSTMYSLALYYAMTTSMKDEPLLESFINGDDAYRNSRFKLIPYISKGSWIVKQSVGKKACLVGQALHIHYFSGKNYLELDIDIGSSTVARGVVNLVLGYLNNLVIEMAFLVQANTEEELPEKLLGTCRLNHVDESKAVLIEQ